MKPLSIDPSVSVTVLPLKKEREELYLFRSVKKVEEEEMRSKRYLNEIVEIKRYLITTILFEFAISFDDIEMGFLSSSL